MRIWNPEGKAGADHELVLCPAVRAFEAELAESLNELLSLYRPERGH